mmetsp:Transcript_38256/g.57685  ORF Transcript_38256/g.57685 Transcript_38256/m.57685 type:complete len:94 (+) Transcript_38256:103-384(+)
MASKRAKAASTAPPAEAEAEAETAKIGEGESRLCRIASINPTHTERKCKEVRRKLGGELLDWNRFRSRLVRRCLSPTETEAQGVGQSVGRSLA